MSVMIPAYYYAQQGADRFLPNPGVGFGGWKETEVPVDWEHTAIIVMHAWDSPDPEENEGVYQCVEYIQRAKEIVQNKFPGFLQAVRRSGARLIHVAAGFEKQLEEFAGYQRIKALYPPQVRDGITPGKAMQDLRLRHWRLTGAEDDTHHEQIEAGYAKYRFAILPQDHEDVVTHANQLLEVCKAHGIEHLIYTGFAVNACLISSACGMLDMDRRGVMCSIVGDLTTAVENKESCVTQRNREYGLWQFATQSGFVFVSEQLQKMLPQKAAE